MLTCANCEKQVIPTKSFNTGWFVFWLLFTGIGAIGYLIYLSSQPSTRCPVCQEDVYGRRGLDPQPKSLPAWVDDSRVMAGVIFVVVVGMAIAGVLLT